MASMNTMRRMMREADALNLSREAERMERCETPTERCYGTPRWYRNGLRLRFTCEQCAYDDGMDREAECEGVVLRLHDNGTTTEEACGASYRMGTAYHMPLCGGCLEDLSDAEEGHREGACDGCPVHALPYRY